MAQNFISKTKELTYKTKYRLHFITITKEVEEFVKKSKVGTGAVVIQTHHTTCGIWINENEKNLIGDKNSGDLRRILDRFAGPKEDYGHNDIQDSKNPKGKRSTHLCEPDENGVINECINGHAHAQAMVLPSSISMIVENGKLVKGTWQEIMLVELDHNRERKITLLAQGVMKN